MISEDNFLIPNDIEKGYGKSMSYASNIRQFVFIAVLAFGIFLQPSPLRAEGTPVLRVAYNPLPPWKTMEKDKVPGGIDTELLRLLAERMGFELEFRHGPFARCLYMLESGQADIMTGVLRSPEREQYLHYLVPPVRTHSDKAFYVRKESGITIGRYEDLYDLRIGTNIRVNYFPRFDNDPKLLKDPAPKDFMINLRKLLKGRVDVVIGTEVMADYYLVKHGLAGDLQKCPYVYSKPNNVHIVLSKFSPHAHRLAEFNGALHALLEEGTMETIKKGFFRRLGAERAAFAP